MASLGKREGESCPESNVSAKYSSQLSSGNKLEQFIQWCTDRHFNISAKVTIETERSCAQYGMVAVQDIEAGEVLFSVPRPSLLSPRTSSIAGLLQEARLELIGDSSNQWVPLLLALLYEYNDPKSPWRPYLDLVPDFSQLDLPLFWDEAEREKLLKGTGVAEVVTQDLALMKRDFTTKALPFMQKHPQVFSPACHSYDLYQRMVAFLMAYSFTESFSDYDSSDEEETEASGGDTTRRNNNGMPSYYGPLMVPMADLLNHVAKNNASLKFEKDALCMVTTQAIKKGEEVFNTYGDLANQHLLHMYGFAERYPLNHYDTVSLPPALLTEAALAEVGDQDLMSLKLQYLHEQDLHHDADHYVMGVEGILTDEELQSALKVLVMTDEEFQEHASKEGWSDAESDDGENVFLFDKIPKLPQNQKKVLLRCAEQCLSRIAGDEQEDAVAMETDGKNLPSRARYALYLRYGQRKLLRQLLDSCKAER